MTNRNIVELKTSTINRRVSLVTGLHQAKKRAFKDSEGVALFDAINKALGQAQELLDACYKQPSEKENND